MSKRRFDAGGTTADQLAEGICIHLLRYSPFYCKSPNPDPGTSRHETLRELGLLFWTIGLPLVPWFLQGQCATLAHVEFRFWFTPALPDPTNSSSRACIFFHRVVQQALLLFFSPCSPIFRLWGISRIPQVLNQQSQKRAVFLKTNKWCSRGEKIKQKQ